jgi:hypothetical protein
MKKNGLANFAKSWEDLEGEKNPLEPKKEEFDALVDMLWEILSTAYSDEDYSMNGDLYLDAINSGLDGFNARVRKLVGATIVEPNYSIGGEVPPSPEEAQAMAGGGQEDAMVRQQQQLDDAYLSGAQGEAAYAKPNKKTANFTYNKSITDFNAPKGNDLIQWLKKVK